MQETEQEPKSTDVAAVWGLGLTAIHCTLCGEAHLAPEDAIPPRCPFCLQGPVAPQPAYLRDEAPEQVLPYSISRRKLNGILEGWMEGVRFRPDELEPEVMARRAQRYFVPLWLVDGRVEGAWRADVGFDYQAVSYQDRYSDGGGWSSREVKEGRVRWEPRAGRIDRGYDNVAAPAMDDHRAMMKRLGKYKLGQRTDYSPEAVSGSAIRIPTLDPDAAWDGVEAALVRAAGAECREAAGADHIRDFTPEVGYSDLNWTLLLLPAFVTWYRQGERVWPVLVNGQSGRVSGVRRASARKANTTSMAIGGVALLLILFGGLLSLLGAAFPPLIAVGGLILVVGLLTGLAAPIPAVSVWVFNRRSTPDDDQ